MRKNSLEKSALFLFFFSGATSLVYEVVWTRQLVLIFGGTSYAISTVLAAFMCGLALGSYVIGRVADRKINYLLTYGVLEIGIGIWAVLLPFFLSLLGKLYVHSYSGISQSPAFMTSLRFFSTFLVLLVPASLMGGTLPVLIKCFVRKRGELLTKPGLLYAVNTLGAVAGTFTSGYLLIPAFGLRNTTLTAVFLNIAIAICAFVLASSRRPLTAADVGDGKQEVDKHILPSVQDEPARASAAAPPGSESLVRPAGNAKTIWSAQSTEWLVPLAYGISGFGALALEVVWTKLLCGVLGTTVYAFSAMLTTFLFGLALGSWVISAAGRLKEANPIILLGCLQLGVGCLVLATIPVFGILPILFFKLFGFFGPQWSSQTVLRFSISFLIMILPTFFLGGTFPLAARAFCGRLDHLGKRIGVLYAANTVGAVLGSLAAGFLLVPALGKQSSLIFISAVFLLLGSLLLAPRIKLVTRPRQYAGGLAALSVMAILLPLALRPWDKGLMDSGLYVYAPDYKGLSDLKESLASQRLLFFEESPEATVSVWRSEGATFLRINGKTDASTGADEITQKLSAHAPILLHKHPEDVLVIGLGSGMTANSVLHHPVKRVVCAEIIPGLLKSASFFNPPRRNFLGDPRFQLVEDDGRNFLFLSKEKFDCLISEPSNPWIAGIGTLFTHEFFELAKEHLRPDGIMCQWVHIYQMSESDLKDILYTFNLTFPEVMVWMSGRSDLFLIGSGKPLTIDFADLSRGLSTNLVSEDLFRLGLNTPVAFISNFIFGSRALPGYLKGKRTVVTDDHLTLEYSAPKNMYAKTDIGNLSRLFDWAEPVSFYLSTMPEGMTEETFASYLEGRRTAISTLTTPSALDAEGNGGLWRSLALAPNDCLVKGLLSRSLRERGNFLLEEGKIEEALSYFRASIRTGTFYEREAAMSNTGLSFFRLGEADSAAYYWQNILSFHPENSLVRYNLALLYAGAGMEDRAIEEYRQILRFDPWYTDAMNNLAWLLSEKGDSLNVAEELAMKAVRLSRIATNLDTAGWVKLKLGKKEEALKYIKKAAELDPDNAEVHYHLSIVYASLGMKSKALREVEKSLKLTTDPALIEKITEERRRLAF
ncbi:MAG: fused MFS/spermidine synthase [Candidatus Eisenbacteria bacterium]|nr:fused MFS/spermidine synthase [Candidatus Eisenbacteria bacterium]